MVKRNMPEKDTGTRCMCPECGYECAESFDWGIKCWSNSVWYPCHCYIIFAEYDMVLLRRKINQAELVKYF